MKKKYSQPVSDESEDQYDSSTDEDQHNSSQPEDSDDQNEDDEFIDKTKNYPEIPLNAKFAFNTFPLPLRDPDTRFALSYDVALTVGLRDSLSFFNKYPLITRLWTSLDEREYLVSIHALSANVKYRNIGIVDVRQLLGLIQESLLTFALDEDSSKFPVNANNRHNDEEYHFRGKRIRKKDQMIPSLFAHPSSISNYFSPTNKQDEEALKELQQTLPLPLQSDQLFLFGILSAASYNSKMCLSKNLAFPNGPQSLSNIPSYIASMNSVERINLNSLLMENKLSIIEDSFVKPKPDLFPFALIPRQHASSFGKIPRSTIPYQNYK